MQKIHRIGDNPAGVDVAFSKLNSELWKYTGRPGQLIPLLQSAQESYGYISDISMKYISGITAIPESTIYGVITFYKQFRLRPLGKYVIRLCDGTACHVNDSKVLRTIIEDELDLEGGDTTLDGLFTLEPVACLGCCSLAPVIMVNDITYGRLTPRALRKIVKKYKKMGRKSLAA
ncbi:MAG: NADH-quinone oxidoreductase subunit NuoE [Proteobacteria bacterium]|nr:NADH-quinone oxidoreductase subunit NuoE [Pseudomonadota bacterium]